MPYRREYDDHNGEFVGREVEITNVIDWAQNTKKRMLTVTGAPGIGKTWLLKQIFPLLNNPDNKNTLWIDVPRPENIGSWLKETLDELREYYPDIPHYDPVPQPGVLLQQTAEILCQNCTGSFYIVIDKGDELFRDDNRDDWRKFERLVIEPLARLDCIRFIIALHDKQRIQTQILRRSSLPIDLTGFQNEKTGLQHIKRLLAHANNPLPGVTTEKVYKEYLPGYQWEHPCLNAYLICECLTLEEDELLPNFGQIDFLSDVLEALLNNLPPDVPTTIDLLTDLARHVDAHSLTFWTPGTLEEIAGMSNTDAWGKIDEWQVYQLIVEVDGGFKIQESLHKLLIAVCGYENSKNNPNSLSPKEGGDE